MADSETLADLDITIGEKILVTVESSLADIIVVSFVRGLKSFQGALLDATKRGLPCGIEPPEPVPGPDGDKLATIATRFSYFQDKKCSSNVVNNKINPQRNVNSVGKCKNSRPTVRLRPRQVLCNNCRSICNEKNENVDGSRKRKHDDSTTTSIVRRSDRRCSSQQQTDKLNRTNNNDLQTLIPKISRLRTNKVTGELIDSEKKNNNNNFGINLINEKTSWLRQRAEEVTALNNSNDKTNQSSSSVGEPTESSTVEDVEVNVVDYCATPRRLSSSSVESAKIPDDNEEKTQMVAADSTVKSKSSTGRISRKKRSIGSMEDLWDESVFEEQSRNTRTTPIIKISFGSQGEGTVLEIPSKIKNNTIGESDYEADNDDKNDDEINNKINQDVDDGLQEQVDPQKQNYSKDFSCAKAAKRALKRAKKEARRKMLNSGNIVSPGRSPLSTSPRYNPSYDPLSYHRRKHKVKHKKKHKEERKHKNQQQQQQQQQQDEEELKIDKKSDDTKESTTIFNIIPTVDCGESYMAIKEQCLKKKLSISLKRLNTNAYASEYPVSNGSSGCKSPGASSEELSELEPENHEVDTNENTPEFPPPTHPLAIRLASPAAVVTSCLTASGRRMDVGDVVWGKVHGFPWWPGKVVSISLPCEDDGSPPDAQAHVAWYGSSTCSLMPCDRLSPFLEMFKARYNKKKRGPYKEAIKQAQLEAHINVTLSKYDK